MKNKISIKNFAVSLVLSSLLTPVSMSSASTDFCNDRQPSHRLNSQQEGYWRDYEASGLNAVHYISTIAKDKPEAAAWFIKTGGKYGPRDTHATPAEETSLRKALNIIANHAVAHPQKHSDLLSRNTYSSHEDTVIAILNAEFHVLRFDVNNLQAIVGKHSGEIGDLKTDNQSMKTQLSAVKEDVQALKVDNQALKTELVLVNQRATQIKETLEAERVAREADKRESQALIAAGREDSANARTEFRTAIADMNATAERISQENQATILRITGASELNLRAILNDAGERAKQEREAMEARLIAMMDKIEAKAQERERRDQERELRHEREKADLEARIERNAREAEARAREAEQQREKDRATAEQQRAADQARFDQISREAQVRHDQIVREAQVRHDQIIREAQEERVALETRLEARITAAEARTREVEAQLHTLDRQIAGTRLQAQAEAAAERTRLEGLLADQQRLTDAALRVNPAPATTPVAVLPAGLRRANATLEAGVSPASPVAPERARGEIRLPWQASPDGGNPSADPAA